VFVLLLEMFFWLLQIVDIVVSKEAKFGDFVGPR
jgi:hypothetical protein